MLARDMLARDMLARDMLAQDMLAWGMWAWDMWHKICIILSQEMWAWIIGMEMWAWDMLAWDMLALDMLVHDMWTWDMWAQDMWGQDICAEDGTWGYGICSDSIDVISMYRKAYVQVDLKFGGPTGPTKGVQGAKPPASCESVLQAGASEASPRAVGTGS